jgi:hypothetical protein
LVEYNVPLKLDIPLCLVHEAIFSHSTLLITQVLEFFVSHRSYCTVIAVLSYWGQFFILRQCYIGGAKHCCLPDSEPEVRQNCIHLWIFQYNGKWPEPHHFSVPQPTQYHLLAWSQSLHQNNAAPQHCLKIKRKT